MNAPHIHRAELGTTVCKCGMHKPAEKDLKVPLVEREGRSWLCRYGCQSVGCTCRCGRPVVHSRNGQPAWGCQACIGREADERASYRPKDSESKRRAFKPWEE